VTARVVVTVPLRLGGGLNARSHWALRARRARTERAIVRAALRAHAPPAPPVVVTLTRHIGARGRALDDDNAAGALKAVRDEVAAWIGCDDGPRGGVVWRYAQTRSADGVWRVEIRAEEDR
jgi:hypothetical protein